LLIGEDKIRIPEVVNCNKPQYFAFTILSMSHFVIEKINLEYLVSDDPFFYNIDLGFTYEEGRDLDLTIKKTEFSKK
jgi:hypothetical protein